MTLLDYSLYGTGVPEWAPETLVHNHKHYRYHNSSHPLILSLSLLHTLLLHIHLSSQSVFSCHRVNFVCTSHSLLQDSLLISTVCSRRIDSTACQLIKMSSSYYAELCEKFNPTSWEKGTMPPDPNSPEKEGLEHTWSSTIRSRHQD